ncbi:head completion/stabilization protein [Marinobacter sp. X15-166B]|uniref:head completion/stabilization protein n=1 Tax=Marinobacter sp. X15-166B TaxID=1897620 RepID=UPI00085BB271|nr:head completion/stabilization protein [Marinobacter sp. X15-166B]OEY67470.1 hypothetical protein BG841_14190 [Marinobacter sp. X15-166B]
MSLIAAGGATENTAVVPNAPFFPDINLGEFRDAMRLDSTVTDERALHALEVAVFDVNSQLSGWSQTLIADGIANLEGVPVPPWQPSGAFSRLYLRAVWSMAKANLVERYRDYDSTNAGHGKADSMEPIADDYRRDASWAIADLTGTRRTVVELI